MREIPTQHKPEQIQTYEASIESKLQYQQTAQHLHFLLIPNITYSYILGFDMNSKLVYAGFLYEFK